MKTADSARLSASTRCILLLGLGTGLLAAQWKQEALPISVLAALLALTIIKARLIILDFMDLRGRRPALTTALVAWVVFFAVLILSKAWVMRWLAS